jgi:pseudaminic acid biosynthesis-associated methylase
MLRETEQFWKGPFGDSYTHRCNGEKLIASNKAFFDKVFEREGLCYHNRIIEFGANRGMNIIALKEFKGLADTHFAAVEINEEALSELSKIDGLDIVAGSMLDFAPVEPYDLAFTKGVLIHVASEDLRRAYNVLYESSRRYILIAEYYNPKPVEIEYRGHTGRLWKRDFAGEMMDLYPDLKLVDYGFVWRRDPVMPQDDLTWFLMERPSA